MKRRRDPGDACGIDRDKACETENREGTREKTVLGFYKLSKATSTVCEGDLSHQEEQSQKRKEPVGKTANGVERGAAVLQAGAKQDAAIRKEEKRRGEG